MTNNYKKLTNSHIYLLLCSSDPITSKDPSLSLSSFVFAAFAAKMRTSKPNVWKSGLFLQRGYPTFPLNTTFSKAAQIPRSEILTDPDVTGNNQIPQVLTYHSFNFKVGNVIRKNLMSSPGQTSKHLPFSTITRYLCLFDTAKIVRSSLPLDSSSEMVRSLDGCLDVKLVSPYIPLLPFRHKIYITPSTCILLAPPPISSTAFLMCFISGKLEDF